MTKQLKMLNKNKRKLNKLMVGVSNIFEEDKLYFWEVMYEVDIIMHF